MPRQSKSTTLLSALWLLLASSAPRAAAVPYPKDDLYLAGYGYLEPRQCAGVTCGASGQYCCDGGKQCVTADGVAMCTAAGGAFNYYTSTWTVTYTTTWSSWIPAATGINGADCIPEAGSGHIACGKICCDTWQYCAHSGQCMANGPAPGGGGVIIGTTVTTAIQTRTTQFSAPFRVTSGTATVTSTGTAAQATETGGGEDTVAEGSTAGGLSGGAIAGIVVGTIAGIALLLLICACCVVRGLWHGVMAILGLGSKDKKKKSETIIEEEHYHRHGAAHTRRDTHGSWYGGRPSTVASRKEKKKSGAGLLGIGAALGTLALLLGLRKDKNKKKAAVKSRSDISSSYYSDVYTDRSPSSRSSDRRTHRSHRHSRTGSRVTRTTTRVSRAPSARSARGPSRSPRRSPPR
ncbi:hypothetical protein QBC35DRAFT_199292 [Podospora australis]|uniref:Mid2 domain-containing protein n=1 Tax=Podospora australis TaxID=1536484 RepID=A0AAN6X253_9PEZI|nr:hypothetical protein QBC35DRAFT_199292 [Podospora australis]